MGLLIRGGTLVTMDRDRSVRRADLRVEAGLIARIGPDLPVQPGDRVVQVAEGRVVIPGLVQAHVHLCQTLLRNQAEGRELLSWLSERVLPLEAAHDPASLRASAELGILELVRSGTTAILDMGTVHHTEVLFEAAAELGLRYVGGKALMDEGAGPARLRERPEEALAQSVELARRFHGQAGGRLRYAFAPRFALSCSEGLLRESAAEARRLGTRLHTHASENRGECARVRERTGRDNVEYLAEIGLLGPDAVLAHCVWVSERERAILVQTGAHAVHCPSANLKLASGIAPIPELAGLGVNVALGADGAACNNTLDAFAEMRLASLIHRPRVGPAAFPARAVFELATLGGARALGLEEEVGSLEEGKRADLAIVDLSGTHCLPPGEDPYTVLVHCARGGDVETVVVDGRVLLHERSFESLDAERVGARAREEAARIVRAG